MSAPMMALFYFSPGPVPAELTALARQINPGLMVQALPALPAVAAAIAARPQPVVVLTPRLEPGTELALLQLGADEVLESVGVTREAVAAALARAAARHARHEETERRARLFEALIRLETTAVLSLDAALVIRFASDGMSRLVGYGPDLVGHPVTDFVMPEDLPQAVEYLRRALEHPGQALAGTAILRTAAGRPQRVSGQVINLLEDPAVGWLVIAISDAAAEGWRTRQMEESERVFRELADKAPVHIWTEDATRRLTWENRTALEFTGRTWEEEMGSGWLETVHPEDRPWVVAHYQQTTVAERGFTLEPGCGATTGHGGTCCGRHPAMGGHARRLCRVPRRGCGRDRAQGGRGAAGSGGGGVTGCSWSRAQRESGASNWMPRSRSPFQRRS